MNKALKIFYISNFFLIVILESLNSQPSITWNRLYNGPFNWYDESYGVCRTTDGNFVAVGYSRNPIYSVCVLKVNSYGDTLWFKIIPNSINIFTTAYSVTHTADGGCVFTGQGDSLFAAKMDVNGKLVWLTSYGSSNEKGFCISKTNDNNFVICGEGGLIMKINENGYKIWKKYISADRLSKIINGIDDGYVATGSVRIGSDTSRALLIKVDTAGNLKWRNDFIIHNSTAGTSVDTTNHSYIIAGQTNARIGQKRENFILKTGLDGKEIFRKLFIPNESEYFVDLKVINPNRYIICANRDSNTTKFIKFLSTIYVVDNIGNIIIDKTYNSVETQFLHSIAQVGNGDLIFAGSARI